MDELLAQAMNRRRLLKMAAGGAAAAGLAPLLGASPASARSSAGDIKMWWWGQQEAVGIQTWMDDTIKKFKAQTGSSVDADADGHRAGDPAVHEGRGGRQRAGRAVPVQRDLPHGERLARLPQAAQRPASPPRRSSNGGGTTLSNYQGKPYRTGFYALGFGVAVQQGALRQGRPRRRLAADDVGRVPGRLRQAQGEGLHPARRRHQGRLPRRVVARQLADAEPQHARPTRSTCSSASSTGATPKYHEHWVKLQELTTASTGTTTSTSLELYQGIQLFNTGKASMALNNTPALPELAEEARQGRRRLHEAADVRHRQDGAASRSSTRRASASRPRRRIRETAAKFIDFMHSPGAPQGATGRCRSRSRPTRASTRA